MTRTALAFGSFIVGAVFGSLALSLIQTSTRVQAFQEPRTSMSIPGAEPTVPPLRVHMVGGGIGGGEVQALDGLDCERCSVAATVITYGGGAFRCVDCKIQSKGLQLKGAALNTLNMLRFVGAIPTPVAPKVPERSPMLRANIEIKAESKVTWISLEGVKE